MLRAYFSDKVPVTELKAATVTELKTAMISPLLSAEVRKFCETTSVRGIPRIIKSRSIVLSIMWSLGVLICAGLLLWQLAVVFQRYTSYPVNTLLVQAPDWQNATFPDITVCNLCPLVLENEMSLRYTDYVSIINKDLKYEPVKKLYELYNKSLDMNGY